MNLRYRLFRLQYGHHFRRTMTLAVPVVIGQLGFVMMGVIDTLMIGQLGAVPLSASALSNAVFFILTVVALGITFAISPLVAEADAAGQPQRCGAYLRQGVWVGIGSSILICLLVLGANLLLPYTDQPAEDLPLAQSYLHLLTLSIPPMILFMVYKQFTDGLSLVIPAMMVTLLGLGFNTLANWLLIFGKWGFPAIGLDGAGWGTLASRVFMLVLMAGYVVYAPRFRQYQPQMRWREFEGKVIRKIVLIGLPSGLQYFFEVGAFGGAVIMIGWLGTDARAAHQIVLNLASVSYMVVSGISAAAAIRVGNELGRRDPVNLRRAGLTGIYLALVFMSGSAVAFLAGRYALPGLYTQDPAVLETCAGLMIIAAFFSLFDGVQAVAIGVLRGMQDVIIPTIISFFAYWLITFLVGYTLSFPLGLGVKGMWYSFLCSLGTAAIALTWRFLRLSRQLPAGPLVRSGASVPDSLPVLLAESGSPEGRE